jgi:pyridoxal phosphate enzyme (YggS family)
VIKGKLETIKHKIEQACHKAGRDPGSVRVLAVSKSFDAQAINEAKALGISYFGENRVQEARDKAAEGVFQDTTLCMIGHLQTNKASLTTRIFDEVHSVDRPKLATALSKFSLKYRDCPLPVYLQVNISGERNKHGCKPGEAYELARYILELEGLELRGLMTIPPLSQPPGDSRLHFRNLRLLRDHMLSMGIPAQNLQELSMGMSSDYEVAIKEGATVIRLGTALFGPRLAKGKDPEAASWNS